MTCEIRTASDGTKVRVNGDIDQATLDRLTAQVRAHVASRCNAPSAFVMPEIAQKIHGRETYRCGREVGHPGPHAWGDRRWEGTD